MIFIMFIAFLATVFVFLGLAIYTENPAFFMVASLLLIFTGLMVAWEVVEKMSDCCDCYAVEHSVEYYINQSDYIINTTTNTTCAPVFVDYGPNTGTTIIGVTFILLSLVLLAYVVESAGKR